jgi:hypothetical protein
LYRKNGRLICTGGRRAAFRRRDELIINSEELIIVQSKRLILPDSAKSKCRYGVGRQGTARCNNRRSQYMFTPVFGVWGDSKGAAGTSSSRTSLSSLPAKAESSPAPRFVLSELQPLRWVAIRVWTRVGTHMRRERSPCGRSVGPHHFTYILPRRDYGFDTPHLYWSCIGTARKQRTVTRYADTEAVRGKNYTSYSNK